MNKNSNDKTEILLEKLKEDSAEYKDLDTGEYSLNDALCQDLCNCYENVLQCCVDHHIKSVAFCCISTGEFHFPNEKAAEIACDAAIDFLAGHGDSMEGVIFNVFKDSDRQIYEKILAQV